MSFILNHDGKFIVNHTREFNSLKAIPEQIDNLTMWLDAQDPSVFTYTSGIAVGSWKDKSPNGWVVAGSGNRPDRIASGINGKPAVQFVAADSERLFFSPSNHAQLDPETGGMTAFVVLQLDTTPSVFGIINKGNDTGSVVQGWSMYGEGGSANVFRTRLRSNAPATAGQSVAVNSNPIVLMSVWNGSSVKGLINNSNTGWTDGGAGPTDNTYAATISSTSDFSIGTLGANYGNITIGEIIIYKRNLAVAERAVVYSYLQGKWGL